MGIICLRPAMRGEGTLVFSRMRCRVAHTTSSRRLLVGTTYVLTRRRGAAAVTGGAGGARSFAGLRAGELARKESERHCDSRRACIETGSDFFLRGRLIAEAEWITPMYLPRSGAARGVTRARARRAGGCQGPFGWCISARAYEGEAWPRESEARLALSSREPRCGADAGRAPSQCAGLSRGAASTCLSMFSSRTTCLLSGSVKSSTDGSRSAPKPSGAASAGGGGAALRDAGLLALRDAGCLPAERALAGLPGLPPRDSGALGTAVG